MSSAASSSATTHTSSEQEPGSASYGYSWVPPGLGRAKVEEYFSQLPGHKVPRLSTPGEVYREKQLLYQLPRQDLAAAYCKYLGDSPLGKDAYDDFVNMRNESALDIAYVDTVERDARITCLKCNENLSPGALVVIAPKFDSDTGWHPACFTCHKCEELLVDLTYCAKEGRVYCERHFSDSFKPRCNGCDELIFAGEYTKAMNRDWHSDHFCCWRCDRPLTDLDPGARYIVRDERPYCTKCYESAFANTCDMCERPIGMDSKDLSYKDKHWHESCFVCSACHVSLVDQPFGAKSDKVFCADCYDKAFAQKCDACSEVFKAGMKKMEYRGKHWHEHCFTCALCRAAIGTRSFVPKHDDVYCVTCYEDKFATKCTRCRKVITAGGVTYRNEPWHRECFQCAECGKSLAGQRFTSKEDKPYCGDCFAELYAKRCARCSKPITGTGGTKFVSFEERHWHNECFRCSQCDQALVGKGFISDGPDVLCPDCAKARLMTA